MPKATPVRARRCTLLALLTLALPIDRSDAHTVHAPAPPAVSAVAAGGERRIPRVDPVLPLLPSLAAAERALLARLGIEPGFAFTNRREASGISFIHRVVADAAKDYKMVHYDHGSGVAAADVDGDGLLDLYFVNQVGGSALWRNRGGGGFEEITARAGVALADRVGVAASFGDLDNDGDPDLLVTTVRGGNALFENLGGGRFRDVSASAGVGYSGHSSGAVLFDFDRDGLLDLFVANVGVYTSDAIGPGGYRVGLTDAFAGHLHPGRAERSLLYRNLGGLRFAEVAESVGLVALGWTGDATPLDLDGDGFPGLYVLDMQGDDRFWENVGGRFVDHTKRHFPRTPWGAMGVKAFDANGDERIDLMITDMHSDMSQEVPPSGHRMKSDIQWSDEQLQGGDDNIFGNALFLARAQVGFEETSDRMAVETYWPWGVSVGDLDADGWPDLFVTSSMNFPFHYLPNALFLNHRGERFVPAEHTLGVAPSADDGTLYVPWFTLDCDRGDREHAGCRDLSGEIAVLAARGSRSSVILDLDADGDLDIVTGDFNGPPQVLTSDLAQRRRVAYLEVALVGRRSNRDGLGAQVAVVSGGRRQVQVHDGKSGYLAQSALPLYFGLGAAETVERVEVRWPSGTVQSVPGPIRPGQRLEVVEAPGA